jgi:hypothetical protein
VLFALCRNYTVDALVIVAGEGAFFYYLFFQFIVCICTLNLVIAYLVETLEIAVKNLSMQRADKDDERRQRREAELWAKEMIDMRDDAPRRLSADGDDDPTQSPLASLPDDPNTPVARTATVAPTIEKKKKRIGVFEEDALKHAELHKGGEDDENSTSSNGTSLSSLYPGVNEELTAEGETEPGAAEDGRKEEKGNADPEKQSQGQPSSPKKSARGSGVKDALHGPGEVEGGSGGNGRTPSPRAGRTDVLLSTRAMSPHRESTSGANLSLTPLSPRATLISSRPPTSLPALERPIVAKRVSGVAGNEVASVSVKEEATAAKTTAGAVAIGTAVAKGKGGNQKTKAPLV